ncbi:MAG TPA: hypothetical protein VM434_17530 [Beijerinckiaceae bacterium]|nr:hypothetical protein [Beijerinckiaceae bacterium]
MTNPFSKPSWSDAEILFVRGLARRGAPAAEIHAAGVERYGWRFDLKAFRSRASRYGITFVSRRAHHGTTGLSL